jgi:hypothetical protein
VTTLNCGNCSRTIPGPFGSGTVHCLKDSTLKNGSGCCEGHAPYPIAPEPAAFNASGSKYLRKMTALVDGRADVYAVLDAFKVSCPARQHAIKKLLCTGLRGKGDSMQDLKEARDAVDRSIQMEAARIAEGVNQ